LLQGGGIEKRILQFGEGWWLDRVVHGIQEETVFPWLSLVPFEGSINTAFRGAGQTS
jgi:hypothetical protein